MYKSRRASERTTIGGREVLYFPVFCGWFHHRVIVVTQICEYAFVAARSLKHADTLTESKQPFMKVVDDAGILRKERLQEIMGCISSHFFPDKPDTH
jgi:hypothetical protein